MEKKPLFEFNPIAARVTVAYALALAALMVYLFWSGHLKGALLGKLVGFASAVSVVAVLYLTHSSADRERIRKLDAQKDVSDER